MSNRKIKAKFRKLLGEEWYNELSGWIDSGDFNRLIVRLSGERESYTVYPEKGSDRLFLAFRTTPLSKVKVVILGQDPYHDGSYDGFAFSNTLTRYKMRISPSLSNILKEVNDDIYSDAVELADYGGLKLDVDPNLQRWADQGVLLINTAHTVRKREPASHLDLWSGFTQTIINSLIRRKGPVIWMLWGNKAKNHLKGHMIKTDHLILESPHPSPYSAASGFFGCKHFSRANEFLKRFDTEPIIW